MMTEDAANALDAAAVGVLAFRNGRGEPRGWPITPYREGASVVVTSTLAFAGKTRWVRRDGRVAVLAGGYSFTGDARVWADAAGREFVARFLAQELRKYPPARRLVRIPMHRRLFSWYFGRVMIELAPETVERVEGSDRFTLITVAANGYPVIAPIAAVADFEAAEIIVRRESGGRVEAPEGPAAIVAHREPTMDDLRQLVIRGEMRSGVFRARSRSGSITSPAPAPRGIVDELRRQIDFNRRARASRRAIRQWKRE